MRPLRDMTGKLIMPKREMQPPAPGWDECPICEMKLPPGEKECPGCEWKETDDT